MEGGMEGGREGRLAGSIAGALLGREVWVEHPNSGKKTFLNICGSLQVTVKEGSRGMQLARQPLPLS